MLLPALGHRWNPSLPLLAVKAVQSLARRFAHIFHPWPHDQARLSHTAPQYLREPDTTSWPRSIPFFSNYISSVCCLLDPNPCVGIVIVPPLLPTLLRTLILRDPSGLIHSQIARFFSRRPTPQPEIMALTKWHFAYRHAVLFCVYLFLLFLLSC